MGTQLSRKVWVVLSVAHEPRKILQNHNYGEEIRIVGQLITQPTKEEGKPY